MLYLFVRISLDVFTRIFFRIEVKGVENIPRQGAVILAANHRSYLDPPLVGLRVPRKVSSVSKTVLYRYPYARFIFKKIGLIPLRLGKRAVGVVSAMKVLKKQKPLVIFPEGTRNFSQYDFLPGNPGVAFLAEGSGAPVVPVYLGGTDKALPQKAWIFRPRKVMIIYGKPIAYTGEGHQEFADKVMSAIARLKRENGPYR